MKGVGVKKYQKVQRLKCDQQQGLAVSQPVHVTHFHHMMKASNSMEFCNMSHEIYRWRPQRITKQVLVFRYVWYLPLVTYFIPYIKM